MGRLTWDELVEGKNGKEELVDRMATALAYLMDAEGGEAGDSPLQKKAWKKAEKVLAEYFRIQNKKEE